MITASGIQFEFQSLANEIGVPLRIRYYTLSFSGADYDSIGYLSASGTDAWLSGIVQPVGGKTSSEDFKFLEQGRIQLDDSKFYVNGSVSVAPTNGAIKIGLGSPNRLQYYVLDNAGIQVWRIGDVNAYQRGYMRILNGGSFLNEI